MGQVIRETENFILVDAQHTNKPICVANIPYVLVFQWLGGPIDTYIYHTKREFQMKLEEFHMYEEPAHASGRIVFSSDQRLLDEVRKNG